MQRCLPRLAFWLVPELRARLELAQMINELGGRYGAPRFLPHLTLYSCRRSSEQAELAILSSLARQFRPMTLQLVKTATGERLAQTLYYEIAENDELLTLHRALHAAVPHPSDYRLHPHLSLLYQELTAKVRGTLVEEIMPFSTLIRFNELRAVAIPERLSTVEDFAGWQTLLIARLRT